MRRLRFVVFLAVFAGCASQQQPLAAEHPYHRDAFDPGAAAQERSDGCAGVVRGAGSPVGDTLALALLRFAPELRKNALPYIRSRIVEYEKRGEDDRKNKQTAASEDTQ
jgi:hypothetical protein